MTRGERIRFYVMLVCFIACVVGGTLNVAYAIGPRWPMLCLVTGAYASLKVLISISRKALSQPVEQVKA